MIDRLAEIQARAEAATDVRQNWQAYHLVTQSGAVWTVDYGHPTDLSERFDLFEDPPEAVARFVAGCEDDVPYLLARVAALETAARPIVEMLDQHRVSLYGAADAFREKVERLRAALEQAG